MTIDDVKTWDDLKEFIKQCEEQRKQEDDCVE